MAEREEIEMKIEGMLIEAWTNSFISDFGQFAELTYNQWRILAPVADLCLIANSNPRVAHIAQFSKKKRVRKKNINRIIKAYKK